MNYVPGSKEVGVMILEKDVWLLAKQHRKHGWIEVAASLLKLFLLLLIILLHWR